MFTERVVPALPSGLTLHVESQSPSQHLSASSLTPQSSHPSALSPPVGSPSAPAPSLLSGFSLSGLFEDRYRILTVQRVRCHSSHDANAAQSLTPAGFAALVAERGYLLPPARQDTEAVAASLFTNTGHVSNSNHNTSSESSRRAYLDDSLTVRTGTAGGTLEAWTVLPPQSVDAGVELTLRLYRPSRAQRARWLARALVVVPAAALALPPLLPAVMSKELAALQRYEAHTASLAVASLPLVTPAKLSIHGATADAAAAHGTGSASAHASAHASASVRAPVPALSPHYLHYSAWTFASNVGGAAAGVLSLQALLSAVTKLTTVASNNSAARTSENGGDASTVTTDASSTAASSSPPAADLTAAENVLRATAGSLDAAAIDASSALDSASAADAVIAVAADLAAVAPVSSATAAASAAAAAAAAATLSWVAKDLLGQLGGIALVARTARADALDADAKRHRVRANAVYAVASLFEVFTPLFPAHFVALAAAGNVGKNLSWLTTAATKAAAHMAFTAATRGANLGDVTAKASAQATAAGVAGTVLGACVAYFATVSSALLTVVPEVAGAGAVQWQPLLPALLCFTALSSVSLLAAVEAMAVVGLPALTRQRADLLARVFVRNADAPRSGMRSAARGRVHSALAVADVGRLENFILPYLPHSAHAVGISYDVVASGSATTAKPSSTSNGSVTMTKSFSMGTGIAPVQVTLIVTPSKRFLSAVTVTNNADASDAPSQSMQALARALLTPERTPARMMRCMLTGQRASTGSEQAPSATNASSQTASTSDRPAEGPGTGRVSSATEGGTRTDASAGTQPAYGPAAQTVRKFYAGLVEVRESATALSAFGARVLQLWKSANTNTTQASSSPSGTSMLAPFLPIATTGVHAGVASLETGTGAAAAAAVASEGTRALWRAVGALARTGAYGTQLLAQRMCVTDPIVGAHAVVSTQSEAPVDGAAGDTTVSGAIVGRLVGALTAAAVRECVAADAAAILAYSKSLPPSERVRALMSGDVTGYFVHTATSALAWTDDHAGEFVGDVKKEWPIAHENQ